MAEDYIQYGDQMPTIHIANAETCYIDKMFDKALCSAPLYIELTVLASSRLLWENKRINLDCQ